MYPSPSTQGSEKIAAASPTGVMIEAIEPCIDFGHVFFDEDSCIKNFFPQKLNEYYWRPSSPMVVPLILRKLQS